MEFKEFTEMCNDEIKTYKDYKEGELINNLKTAVMIVHAYDKETDKTFAIELTDLIGMCETNDNSPSPVILLGDVTAKF